MKTSQSTALRFFASTSAFAPGAVLLVVIGLSTVPAMANPQLLFTEYSSTYLTATLDGVATGTVTNVAPDQWDWRSGKFGQSMALVPPNPGELLSIFWRRPGGGTNVFQRTFFLDPSSGPSEIGAQLYPVTWDPFGLPVHENGVFGFTWSAFATGNASGPPTFGPVDVYFLDVRDGGVVTVPDSSATLGLMAAALAILAVFAGNGWRRVVEVWHLRRLSGICPRP